MRTPESALEQARELMLSVLHETCPELTHIDIRVIAFRHRSDFFRTRFSIPHFLFSRRMRFLIRINPRVFELQAPTLGLKAIMVHELCHVLYYVCRKRLKLLGLVRLMLPSFTSRFERWADLEVIARGHAEGLKVYRQWLYQHVPSDTLREKYLNYLSPAEIEAIVSRISSRPELLEYWLENVPMSLEEIEVSTRD